MYRGVDITPPFFEIGPKAYAYGRDVVEIARRADALGARYGVQVIITPQYTDIAPVAAAVGHVLVFAQHMDPLMPGRGVGSVLPEAVRAAGAAGVMLNHVERRLTRDVLARTLRRADEVGLASMVCADDTSDAVELARLGPNIIIVESPDLIAGGQRGSDERLAIMAANQAIWRVNPAIRVLHGAGITGPSDVYEVVAAGAQATGSSSAIFDADDPPAVLEEMIASVRRAWDAAH